MLRTTVPLIGALGLTIGNAIPSPQRHRTPEEPAEHTYNLLSVNIQAFKDHQMRDLGTMGESTFSLWCSQAGLIPNGSKIDRTGWDFYVEFPSTSTKSPDDLHAAALEYKVQVKSSDKRDRKLQIKLSSLRRLATAQMPALFVFIEFDDTDTAQRAFVVHVDLNLIERVLRRIHESEQVESRTDHNKRTLTINYGNDEELKPLNGQALKSKLESFAPAGMADYVAKKKAFLESIGFENGYAKFTFQTFGEENVRDLIDVSLGIKRSVQVTGFSGYPTRFGITSKTPIVETSDGHLEMPDLKPTASGVVRFREDRLSPALCFDCRLFVSPLSNILPRQLVKFRVEGEGFDFKLSPFAGEAQYNFALGPGSTLPVAELRDTLRLLFLIASSSKKLYAEFSFSDFPVFEMSVNGQSEPFELSKELQALDFATEILNNFGVSDASVSLSDINRDKDAICQFHSVLNAGANVFKVEFGVEGSGFDSTKPVACISLTSVRIGRTVLGLILVVAGRVSALPSEKFQLITSGATIERKLVSDSQGIIPKKDLIAAFEVVEAKYGRDYEVVTMYDKR